MSFQYTDRKTTSFLSFLYVISLIVLNPTLGLATQYANVTFTAIRHLALDYVCMNEQRAQKLACLHFLAISPLSITTAYLASSTPLDHCMPNKTVAAGCIVVNIISSQTAWTAYTGGRD